MVRRASRLAVAAFVVLGAACHEDPNTGLPRAGVRLPWRTYEQCKRRIETYGVGALPTRPYRVISRSSVTCTYYVPDECDDALKARACDLGGDAVLVESLDESSSPKGPYVPSKSGPKKLRTAAIVAWDHASGDAGPIDASVDGD